MSKRGRARRTPEQRQAAKAERARIEHERRTEDAIAFRAKILGGGIRAWGR